MNENVNFLANTQKKLDNSFANSKIVCIFAKNLKV